MGNDAHPVLAGWSEGIRPDPQITVSEWADRHRRLPQKSSAEPGPWRTSRTPYLREVMDNLSVTSPVEEVVFMKGAQVGGPLDVDTPIATVDGWTTMGTITPGQQVFDDRGQPTTVTGASEIFEGRPCYAITFSDDSVLIADGEHRWFVESDLAIAHTRSDLTFPFHGRVPDAIPRSWSGVLTTDQIRASGWYGKTQQGRRRNRYAVPVAQPLRLPEQSLPVDPYVLGVWLGDGHTYSNQITQQEDDAVELMEHLRAAGASPGVRRRAAGGALSISLDQARAGLSIQLARMGLLRSRQRTGNAKRIPPVYLRAGLHQRLALLQGLMDTDGHCAARGTCEFTSSIPHLRDQVFELLVSVGLKPVVYNKPSRIKVSGERAYTCAPYWKIVFRAYADTPVFRLSRKAARLRERSVGRPSETTRRRIVSVEPVASRPVRCIAVDSPSHLYLAGRAMIPTHNTEAILNCLGYLIDHSPGPAMIVQPTVETAKRFSRQRVAPLVDDTPRLAGKVAAALTRDASNSMLTKEFMGGVLIITGANSAVGLRSMPARWLLLDEIDGYPLDVDDEGSPMDLAEARQRTFARRKRIKVSTPTVAGISAIERSYLETDQRRYHVPCPRCGLMQPLEFKQLTWTRLGLKPEQAVYICIACEGRIENHEKTEILARGEWVPSNPNAKPNVRGYHLSALYSPVGWFSWGQVAATFVKAKKNPEKMRVFTNTVLGETWTERGEAPEWERLYHRREAYELRTVPAGGLFLTAGADVQKDRIVFEVVAWGRGKESWSIDWGVFPGDTADLEKGPWKELDALLARVFRHEHGADMPIRMLAVDSGFNTQQVYTWCRKYPLNRVIAIKGVDGGGVLIGSPTTVDINLKGRRPVHGYKMWPVCGSIAKSELYGWLRLATPLDNEPFPAGWCHFPEYGDDYFRQLTAEQLVTRKTRGGFIKHEWELIPGRENHALDARVYARAAAQLLGLERMQETDWVALEHMLAAPAPAVEPAATSAQAANEAPGSSRRGRWLERRRDWLKKS